MSLRGLIKQVTRTGNAAALGYFEGSLYATICLWLIAFSILSAFILGTSWKWVGYSVSLLIGLLLFLFVRAVCAWIKLLYCYFFKMKRSN
jgi:hypothetical protein